MMLQVRSKLFLSDPYATFNPGDRQLDVQGWGSHHPIFEKVINALRPKIIIEVGSWKGASALHMAELVKGSGQRNTEIVCIDTWLGSSDHWLFQENAEFYISGS